MRARSWAADNEMRLVVRALKSAAFAFAISVAVLAPLRVSSSTSSAALERQQTAGEKAYAADNYQAALAAFSTGLSDALNAHNVAYEALFLTKLGVVEMHVGRYADALQSHQQALALDRRLGDREGEAMDLGNIGNVEEELGRYTDALQSGQRALALARQLGDHDVATQELSNIGVVEEDLGRYADALQSGQQTLALDRHLRDRDAEAKDLGNIGNVEDDLGRYADALQSHQQALALDHQLGDRDGEAQDLGNIGNVEEDLGRYADALKSLQQALALDRKLGDRDGESADLGSVGVVEEDLGRYAAALSSHQQALALARHLGDREGEAADLSSIGIVEEDLEHYADALASHRQAFALAQQLSAPDVRAKELANIGFAEEHLGRYSEALASARDAAQLDARISAPRWKELRTAAFAEAKLDNIPGALADYDGAVADIERLRAGLTEKSERTSFFGTALFVYNEYVAYLLDLHRRFPDKGYDLKALEIFERQQARTFLEQIAQSAARNFAGVPTAISDKERALPIQASQLQASLAKARSSTQIASLRAEAARVASAENALEATIEAKYPSYNALLHPAPILAQAQNPSQLTIARFQQRVVQPGEALLVYDVVDDRTALWVITQKALRLVVLPGGTEAIAAKLAAFGTYTQQIQSQVGPQTSLPHLGHFSQDHLAPVTAASTELYTFLVPPEIQPSIADATTLFVVPSGPLYGFPFETLVTQQQTATATRPHYLIEDKAVSYLSSASLLAILRSGVEKQTSAPDPLMAFANPSYTTSSASSTSSIAKLQEDAVVAALGSRSRAYSTVGGFVQLPGTDAEAHAVFAALGLSPTSTTLFEGDDASVATIGRLNQSGTLKDFQYVFFGAHAVLPDQVKGLTQSSLVLSHPPAGFLTMGDVFGLSLDARAVILSACESGGGTVTRGEGVVGLTQAFMYAGTPVVSVTDWEVIDQLQPDFNKVFFSALNGGKTAAAALRQAKLAMLADDDPDDPSRTQPYFWAPTVIFGDGDAR